MVSDTRLVTAITMRTDAPSVIAMTASSTLPLTSCSVNAKSPSSHVGKIVLSCLNCEPYFDDKSWTDAMMMVEVGTDGERGGGWVLIGCGGMGQNSNKKRRETVAEVLVIAGEAEFDTD